MNIYINCTFVQVVPKTIKIRCKFEYNHLEKVVVIKQIFNSLYY